MIKLQSFRLPSVRMKVYQIPHATDASASSFFFKFDIIFQYHDTLLFCNFVTHTSGTLEISMPSKCKFWDFQVLPGTFSKFLVPFLQQHIDSLSHQSANCET